MTRYDYFQLMANAQLSDPKSRLNEKWKDEEALAIAKML